MTPEHAAALAAFEKLIVLEELHGRLEGLVHEVHDHVADDGVEFSTIGDIIGKIAELHDTLGKEWRSPIARH